MLEDSDIIQLWKSQPIQESELDMQLVIDQAAKFQRQIRFRNIREYLACGVVIAWTGSTALKAAAPPLIRAGAVLIALGVLAIAFTLRRHGHAARQHPPLTAPTREIVDWQRSELVRQRDLLRAVPLWYIGPLVPGTVTLMLGAGLASPGAGWRIALTAAFVTLVFGGVALLNIKAAKKLDARIQELEAASDR